MRRRQWSRRRQARREKEGRRERHFWAVFAEERRRRREGRGEALPYL